MDRLLEQHGHAKRPQIRVARNENINDGTIFYDVVRGSYDDGTLDDTNMKAFNQDTAANLTFYDPSLKEQFEQTRYRGH